jgi:hypothetical protein
MQQPQFFMKNCVHVIRNSSLIVLLSAWAISLRAQSTAFTYQGLLYASGSPATGSFDLTFQLFNALANGTAVGPILTNSATVVSNGLFTVPLDFGTGVFTGTNYWVQISARTNGGSTFTTLVPRLPISPAPYAISAANALTAATFSGVIGNAQLSNSTVTINTGTGLSGGGTVPLGGSITLNATGNGSGSAVVSVTGNSDITATTVNGAVTLSTTATDSDTLSTIVKRDSNGNFSAGSITLNGILNMTTSQYNTAVGSGAGGTNGYGNSAFGTDALNDNTTGDYNTATGASALYLNTTGIQNTADGFFALNRNTTGQNNTAIGYYALKQNTGNNNTANGSSALLDNTSGYQNTANGAGALANNTTGYNNIAVGYQAGINQNSGYNNIDIGNNGVASDNNTIRLGTEGTQTNTFIAGIYGVTVSGNVPVVINSFGQLGTSSSSERFKQDIQSMGEASDLLLDLRPVTFRYKPEFDPTGTPQFGLIAEEVNKVDPDLVVRDDKNQIYTVRYDAINAMLLNEVLKQHRKLDEKDAEIRALEQRLDRLESMMPNSARQ